MSSERRQILAAVAAMAVVAVGVGLTQHAGTFAAYSDFHETTATAGAAVWESPPDEQDTAPVDPGLLGPALAPAPDEQESDVESDPDATDRPAGDEAADPEAEPEADPEAEPDADPATDPEADPEADRAADPAADPESDCSSVTADDPDAGSADADADLAAPDVPDDCDAVVDNSGSP